MKPAGHFKQSDGKIEKFPIFLQHILSGLTGKNCWQCGNQAVFSVPYANSKMPPFHSHAAVYTAAWEFLF